MLKPEQEIKSTWNEGEGVVVSILCTTFNHEKYIEDAIRGFLLQETTFPFEVIIHDDASTDATARIARTYADLYPGIIRLVIQQENQYSKGAKVSLIAFGYAKGKYIALCEGDDYWTAPKKLQIQVDEMRRRPACNISFHPAMCVDAGGARAPREICRYGNTTHIIPAEQIVSHNGGYMPTASLILHRSIFENVPDWFREVPVGDYFLQCMASFNAGALYIHHTMSVYRSNVPNSWSFKIAHEYRLFAESIRQAIVCCHLLDKWSAFRFTRAFHKGIARFYLSLSFSSIVNGRLLNAFVFAAKSAYYYLVSYAFMSDKANT